MSYITKGATANILTLFFEGEISTSSVNDIEKELFELVGDINKQDKIVFDFSKVSYISSIGLRLLLKFAKEYKMLKIINVPNEVYNILEMTGFTSMFSITKAFKKVSIKGLTLIGTGWSGNVYRLDEERIIKHYLKVESIEDIYRERSLAKKAFMLGIPTAISFEIVEVEEGGYGSIFELLDCNCFNVLFSKYPERYDELLDKYLTLLKTILSTEENEGVLPNKKTHFYSVFNKLKTYNLFDNSVVDKLIHLLDTLEDSNHLVHGDYHIKNVMLHNNEALLIDMDTLGKGHPIFEISAFYLSYVGYPFTNHQNVQDFFNVPYELTQRLYHDSFEFLFKGKSEKEKEDIQNKISLFGYAWLAYKTYLFDRDNTAQLNHSVEEVNHLINIVDDLNFSIPK